MMNTREAPGALARVIAAHLAEWDDAHVERAIYGTDDAPTIAAALDTFCRTILGAPVAGALCYRSSIGAVAGLELQDGRRVVVKGHQPDWSRDRLAEVVRLQRHLAARGLFAPAVLAGPAALGRGLAVVEAYRDPGAARDARDPVVRRALATSLRAVIDALEPFAGSSMLPSQLLSTPPRATPWPTPHSRLFDFEATRQGADDIDRLAAEARERMTPAGRVVLGHGDWRVEHVRFEGPEVVVAYDWDSLCREPEPALIGFAAHAFCADWSRGDPRQAPSLDEARGFVRDYESARGGRFPQDQRALCAASFAFAVAYTARCGHALGADERREPGTFQHLVAAHGTELLAL